MKSQLPKFPSFYAECAFKDGMRDAEDGTSSAQSYYRHGEPEVIGMKWYKAGVKFAAQQVTQ